MKSTVKKLASYVLTAVMLVTVPEIMTPEKVNAGMLPQIQTETSVSQSISEKISEEVKEPAPTAVPTQTPDTKPSPVPSIFYEVFFRLQESLFTYDADASENFVIRGSGFFCITDIYYGEEKLEADQDYFIEKQYEDSELCFSEDFLDKLKLGSNKLTLHVYMNPTIGLRLRPIEIIKISKELDTPSPVVSLEPSVSPAADVVCETFCTGGVSQRYTVNSTDLTNGVPLSKLKIRFYYTKEGQKEEAFCCDCAGIQSSKAPYYIDCTKAVTGEFGKGYIDITFDSDQIVKEGTLSFMVRFNQSDWSPYTDFEAGKTEVIYDTI